MLRQPSLLEFRDRCGGVFHRGKRDVFPLGRLGPVGPGAPKVDP